MGEWLRDKMHGRGVYFEAASGYQYEGKWSNGIAISTRQVNIVDSDYSDLDDSDSDN